MPDNLADEERVAVGSAEDVARRRPQGFRDPRSAQSARAARDGLRGIGEGSSRPPAARGRVFPIVSWPNAGRKHILASAMAGGDSAGIGGLDDTRQKGAPVLTSSWRPPSSLFMRVCTGASSARTRPHRTGAQLGVPGTDELGEDGMADSASRLYEEEFDEGQVDDLRAELASVKDAEERLAAGTFGLSVESGEPIPDERLEAVPTAERTVDEQTRFERQAG